jgi:FixJ family two-component response regulator
MSPFILITGHGTVAVAVQAMQMGAVTVIEKPFHHDQLLNLLHSVRATARESQAQREMLLEEDHVIDRINSLTSRESEVMELVVKGDLTKQIAKQLGISTKTVEVHRSNITRKMGVQSVAQLVKIVVSAKLRIK